jgi:hypothetical protein
MGGLFGGLVDAGVGQIDEVGVDSAVAAFAVL